MDRKGEAYEGIIDWGKAERIHNENALSRDGVPDAEMTILTRRDEGHIVAGVRERGDWFVVPDEK